MELKGTDKRVLRGLGNTLKATIYVGKEGVSEALLTAVARALDSQELIKIKVLDTCGLHRKEVAAALDEQAEGQVVQVLGRTILIYRRHPEEPEINLPSHPLPRKT